MKADKILIIDDDVHISAMLEEALSREGYEVQKAFSGTEAVLLMEKESPDLILLDRMLPGLNGEELLPKLKGKGIPVIILSARTDVSEKAKLLIEGASDYVTKPFVLEELLARIIVQLRRKDLRSEGDRELVYDNLVLKDDILTVVIKGDTGGQDVDVRLTRTECAILKLLMSKPKVPIGKTAILDRISLDTPDCTERSLKQHVSNLRKKLQAVNGRDYIEAVYGIGFLLK